MTTTFFAYVGYYLTRKVYGIVKTSLVSDLGITLLLFGPCPDPFTCMGDLDGNGEVDAGDIALLLVNWH